MAKTMHTYYISVGSTLVDTESLITEVLLRHFPNGTLSSFTHSKDATGRTDTEYINAVLRLESEMHLDELQRMTKEIEREMGRNPGCSSVVALDLDTVVRDCEVLRPKDFERSYFSQGYDELRGGRSESVEE